MRSTAGRCAWAWPCGGGWTGNDVNIPSGEGLCRAYLYGNEFFMDEFGAYTDDVYLPDCFGFGYQLPTIAYHMGLIGFCTQKFDQWGGWFATPYTIGKWVGPDGNYLISALKPYSYGGGADPVTSDGAWLKANSGNPGIWATYDYIGTGDQGGGPSSGDVSAMVTKIRANATNTYKMYCTRSDQLYRDVTPTMAASLPSFNGELLMTTHGTGSYTSWGPMKFKKNRNEQRAMTAEYACVMANWLNATAYPIDTITTGWRRTCECMFHDMITGTSIPNVYSQYCLPMLDSSYNDLTYAMSIGNNAMANAAGQFLTTTVAAGNVPVVCVNALARARCDIAEATITFGTTPPAGIIVKDPDGNTVNSQILSTSGNNVSIAFVANVPSASYTVFEVAPSATANAPDANLTLTGSATSGYTLTNQFYTVTVNAAGDISQVNDKKTGQNLLGAASRLEMRNDAGTSFPAWELRWADVSAGPAAYVDGTPTFTVQESGPARVSLKIVRTKNNSTFTQYVTLANDSAGNRVEVKNQINWLTTGTLLKVSFPFAFANDSTTWDIGVGTKKRGVMFYNTNTGKGLYEVCGQQWADQTATSGAYGCSILSQCKYGWNKETTSKVNLTLLHSPSGGGYNYQGDQSNVGAVGIHNMTYGIYGHANDWTNGTVGQGERMDQQIYCFQPTTPRAGTSALKAISLVKTSTPQISVMCIKRAEKSNDYVIRVREVNGGSVTGSLIFPQAVIATCSEVNGQENAKGAATGAGTNSLAVSLTKYGMKTFKVTLGATPIHQKLSDLMQPKPSEVRLTVALANSRAGRVDLMIPYGAKIQTLAITDALGRIVQKLAENQTVTSASSITWNGKDGYSQKAHTGVYFVRCVTNMGSQTSRLSVMQ